MENQSFEQFYSISDAEAQQTYVGVRRAKEWVGFSAPSKTRVHSSGLRLWGWFDYLGYR